MLPEEQNNWKTIAYCNDCKENRIKISSCLSQMSKLIVGIHK